MCAAMAVPAAAEEKITADEVKEWLTDLNVNVITFDGATIFRLHDDSGSNKNTLPKTTYIGESVVGDEIRDTDTRAAYIGTDSIYDDVSGELVSYVNELSDLGIINGYI